MRDKIKKLVSVIVPVYRVEKYLERCIDSILAQTYKNLEIVLIDDGSDDQSPIICDYYAEKDKRVKVVHKEHEGLVKARKVAIEQSTGDYIGYVDSDDWIEPNFFEVLIGLMENYACDMVIDGRIEEYEDRRIKVTNRIQNGKYAGLDYETMIKCLFCGNDENPFYVFPTVWGKVFKKDIILQFQENVPEMINIGEDAACVYPALAYAKSVYFTDKCLYHYNLARPQSMLKEKDPLILYRLFCLMEHLRKSVEKSDYKDALLRQFDEYEQFHISDAIFRLFGKRYKLDVNNTRKDYLFPFELVEKGSNVVVYGAGVIGRTLVNQIKYSGYCNLVGWVDAYVRLEETVDIMELKSLEFEKIIIAISNIKTVEEVKETLLSIGIKEEQIIWKKYRM